MLHISDIIWKKSAKRIIKSSSGKTHHDMIHPYSFPFIEQIPRAHFYTSIPRMCALRDRTPQTTRMSGVFCITTFRTRGYPPCAALRLSSQGKRRDEVGHAFCLFYCLTNTPQNGRSFYSDIIVLPHTDRRFPSRPVPCPTRLSTPRPRRRSLLRS